MTSANKFLAVAIVAMFVASGFIVICENVSFGDDEDYDVVIVDAQGVETDNKYFGVYALNTAIVQLHLIDSHTGYSVKLLKNYSGKSIKVTATGGTHYINTDDTGATAEIDSAVTIDLNNFTFTALKPTVGSSEVTATQSIHIESGFDLTIKNGTIKSVDNGAKMLLQNHSASLTLKNVVLDGSNLVQGYEPGTTIPTNVYTLSNNSGTVLIEDSTIIACKAELQNDKNAYTFDVCSNTVMITLKGDVILDGGIEFTEGTAQYTFYVDGTVTMLSGKVVKGKNAEPIIDLAEDSKFLFAEGVQISDMIVDIFRFVNITAGEGGMGVVRGTIESNWSGVALFGNMTTDTTGSVLIKESSAAAVTYDFGIMGVAGKGVSLQFNDNNATIIGALKISEGASWKINGTVVGADDENSYIVVEKGAEYQGETVAESVSYKIDTKGDLTRVIIIVFEVTEHVNSISYEGQTFIEVDYTGAGFRLNLAKIDVDVEDGYSLTGFMIDGVQYGVYDLVKITGPVTVTAIVEEGDHPVSHPDDGKMLVIGAIIVFVALILLLALVFSKKTN